MDGPFHAGEIAVQQRAGVRAEVEAIGTRAIRDHMPAPHRELFERLPSLLVGSLDARGRPWASMLAGRPGFLSAPDERQLRVRTRPRPDDPLAAVLAPGAPLGLLGIEPATRRRNRMNGRVAACDADGFVVAVEQSFGNCPQYIRPRRPVWTRDPAQPAPPARALGEALDEAALALLARADTLFIASAAPPGSGHGVDVSHRGGAPGFVRVRAHGAGRAVLTLPDYRGNRFFNTLGNIAAHPWAGLLCADPASGDLLQLTARATLQWDGAELAQLPGAQRLLHLTVDDALWAPRALPLRWDEPAEEAGPVPTASPAG